MTNRPDLENSWAKKSDTLEEDNLFFKAIHRVLR
jgi:hypothetical protein